MTLQRSIRLLGISSLWIYRALTWAVLIAGFAFAATVLAVRYWVLPNIEQYREGIAQKLSAAAHQRIAIGRISANWDGIRPELVLQDVTVFDRGGHPALELPRVDNTLSWLSLAVLELRLHSLEFHRPTVEVRRDADGVISIAGFELRGGGGEDGFADWLLRQRKIVVRDAAISWHDEMRGAPPLELSQVSLISRNRGGRHRFGLRAVPPQVLAAPLDLRGEIVFDSVRDLAAANGRLYAELDAADIAAWGTWVTFPVDLPSGAGALRTWVRLHDGRVTEALADLRLEDVKVRLAPELAELDLISLDGRVQWKSGPKRTELSLTRLGFTTGTGLTLIPADLTVRLVNDSAGNPLRGELLADAIALEPLTLLADRLPLPAAARRELAAFSPKGRLSDVHARWTGEWNEPQQYALRGRFDGLALKGQGRIPGFTGIAGALETNERNGTLTLASSGVNLDFPKVFRQALRFDTLSGQLAWALRDGEIELRMSNLAFSNAHVAGSVYGTYRTAAGHRGSADLTGALVRADARYVKSYLPLTIGGRAREWLDQAFLAGRSKNVALRLKGDLDRFPFIEDKDGVFTVTAKVTGGVLQYAPGWPRIENIAGDFAFRGERLEVNAQRGTILGVDLRGVTAEIPNLLDKTDNELLRVSGEAEGPSSEFLAFIEKSPVMNMIDRFVEGMRVQGRGRLSLKLDMPLRDRAATKIAGAYEFSDNRLVAADGVPPLEQATGRLEFTEASVRVPRATALFLGGPVAVSAASGRDAAVNLTIRGRADIENLRRQAGSPEWSKRLHGAADWRGAFVVRNKAAEFTVESSLRGLASDLPAPFAKTAQETVRLRYERRFVAGGQRIAFTYGEAVSAIFALGQDGGRAVIRRGTVHFGGAAPEPARDGVWVSGSLQSLDADRWREIFPGGVGASRVPVAGINTKVGILELFGRQFNDVAVSARQQEGAWQSTVSAKELEGTVAWRPQGAGRISARLKRLFIPGAAAPAVAAEPAAAGTAPWPALDVVAEQFRYKDKMLGRLELAAAPAKDEWRIERVRMASPDGVLTGDGVWHTALAQPRTEMRLRLLVNDIGKMLVRLGHPEGVRRGTATLEGVLAWPGGPAGFDYGVLTGALALDAKKGQFVKLEPGIGKLLGILSLQSLPRRISLDFRDVFSEGFAFDEIAGAIAVKRGVASTDGLRIVGPAARVVMSGQVDLARETQSLNVKITPSLSDSVSIAGALIGGPVAGVAAFLAQKVLKDPLGQIASYEYRVAGTWADPQVSKIPKTALGVQDTNQGE